MIIISKGLININILIFITYWSAGFHTVGYLSTLNNCDGPGTKAMFDRLWGMILVDDCILWLMMVLQEYWY